MSEVQRHEVEDERGRDDLDDFLAEELQDPEFRGAYEDALARSALLRALVSRRGECRINQAKVAALMGTTQSAVSDLERGATDPRLSTLQRFARAVGCRLRLLLQVDGPHPRSWLVVQERARLASPAANASEYWQPLATYVAGTGRARQTPLGNPPATRVTPVELRAAPDEFIRAATK